MAQKSRWSTVEGGIANTFPLSINRNTHWTALRRGECYAQDHADYERRGTLRFAEKPQPSTQSFIKEFSDILYSADTQVTEFFAYGRYWKVNLEDKRELLFSEIYTGDTIDFGADNGILFATDGDDPISLVAVDGDGRIFIVKRSCGYVLTDMNLDITSWRVGAPNYGIGTIYTGCGYTTAVINKALALCWDALEGGARRHYLWDGDSVVELSEDVRTLTDAEGATTNGSVNWARNLVIFGPFVYDLNNKRVMYYSGKATASFTSRAYYEANYTPITLYRLAFLTDGKEGSFKATIEYGQADDNLQKTKAFTVKVTPNSRQRVRHVWNLDMPILCRIWRLKIEDLTGCAVVQIDVDSSLADSPDDDDGTM